jgi:DNA-directed RNA polymerase specialized sigma24 family protein
MQDAFIAGEAGTTVLDSAYNFARYLSRDPEAAERIVHAAYLCARNADAARSGRVQLLKFVRDCYSTEPTAAQSECADEPLEDVEPSIIRPENLKERGDMPVTVDATAIRAAIEILPRPLREIWVLKELEMLSYKEIAEVTSLQTQDIMSRLARARRMLIESRGRSSSAYRLRAGNST